MDRFASRLDNRAGDVSESRNPPRRIRDSLRDRGRRHGRGLSAKHTKLWRDIAIKVLSVATDPERLERFKGQFERRQVAGLLV